MTEPAAPPEPLRSVHTTTLPRLLHQVGISLLVSTYQAGKLIVVRADGDMANTHFRNFDTPMGLAFDRGRLAVGTKVHVWEFHDQPEVARRLDPPGRHDACFLPRYAQVTGQIAVHELAWADSRGQESGVRGQLTPDSCPLTPELWAVNTRFSCLCTLDPRYSFVPRWRPPFVTALAPEDRCHLNGLGLRDGRPRYVTALGATDDSAGWRANKARGGILMDVPSGEIIARGLSMPHSPRWYDGRLWVLESGAGSLAVVDPASGRLEPVALLPGFTRGLDFFGPFAFVGLSQVRESALFSGIPITDRLKVEERACGVWVVDTRTGQTVAFLRFESGVQEVFAVQVLPALRYPEILTDESEVVASAFLLPDATLADVPAAAS
ncbi:MAG TPA: TIGR03032 family protein [Gemmataceae bacterium]|nr:TIGR03032 family protein [Gemmataceae bacterium]